MTAVAAGEVDCYRNLEPKSMLPKQEPYRSTLEEEGQGWSWNPACQPSKILRDETETPVVE